MKTALLAEKPLLGTSREASVEELRLAAEIDSLHQLIYSKGGLNSTNAAIEEVSKLIYLKLLQKQYIENERPVPQVLRAVFELKENSADRVAAVKEAFSFAKSQELVYAKDLLGERHSIWPDDEPFRISNLEVLVQAINIVNSLEEEKSNVLDPLGTAFDAFLSGRYDHSGGLGTYLTPSSVARFMAEVALRLLPDRLRHDDSAPFLLDPFCGTGRFLVAGMQAISESHSFSAMQKELWIKQIAGADQSDSAVAKSALNLLLYGSNTPQVFSVDDSISDSSFDDIAGKVHLILTNPPFGEGKYDTPSGLHLTKRYFPSVSTSKIDPALGGLARCLDLLADDGILGIVLPDGVINGRHFTNALHCGTFSVLASYALPTATFALSGTVARTSALFIRKGRQHGCAIISRVDHVGFIRKAGKAAIDPEGNQLPSLLEMTKEVAGKYSDDVVICSSNPLLALVPLESLTSVDPSRFDAESMQAKTKLQAAGAIQLNSLCRPVLKRRRLKTVAADAPFISVLHVDAYGTVDWAEAECYEPTTAGQVAYPGEVLISLLNPSKLRATVVPDRFDYVQCSAEFGILGECSFPFALLALLQHSEVSVQLRPLGSGTSSSRRRITIQDVLDLFIPNLTDSDLVALNNKVRDAVDLVDAGRKQLRGSY